MIIHIYVLDWNMYKFFYEYSTFISICTINVKHIIPHLKKMEELFFQLNFMNVSFTNATVNNIQQHNIINQLYIIHLNYLPFVYHIENIAKAGEYGHSTTHIAIKV